MDTATALRVREYIDHLNDPPYVHQVFTFVGVDGVARVLLAMLRSRDADEVIAAHLFLWDVVNYGMVPAFTVQLPTSGIFEVLRTNLYVPDLGCG